jgi:hypothetical protein
MLSYSEYMIERELSQDELDKREEIIKAMKRDGQFDFDDPEDRSKAYAIATAKAKESA